MTDLDLKSILRSKDLAVCVDKAECPHKIHRKGKEPICDLPFIDFISHKDCRAQRFPNRTEKVNFT